MIRKKLGAFSRFNIYLIWKLRLLFSRPQKKFIFVTGSDSSHYKSALQLLRSHSIYVHEIPIVFYDLGLKPEEKSELLNLFNKVIYIRFQYEKYPEYFDLDKNSGAYAWKPQIIREVVNKYQLPTIWLDAGNIITRTFQLERQIMKKFGIFTTVTRGTIGDWTHSKTINKLNANDILHLRELNGACVGFNNKNKNAENILNLWSEYALVEDIINPAGSNKLNHRFDQAVLSILIHKHLGAKFVYFYKQVLNWPVEKLSFKMHCDIN